MYTVGELAKLTGVTVRTLHHYDEIGLLRPSGRSAAGYRLYGDDDVLRLRQIVVLRELGLPLDRIAEALAESEGKRRVELLREQRAALLAQRSRVDAMLASVDEALELEEGEAMNREQVRALFDGVDPEAYREESEQRWGATEAYQESTRRTERYTKEDWARYKREAERIGTELAGYMREGRPVRDLEVQAAVEAHRMLIDRWFYACSVEMHKALGAMYVADPRFTESLDKLGEGYARYLSDAIAAS